MAIRAAVGRRAERGTGSTPVRHRPHSGRLGWRPPEGASCGLKGASAHCRSPRGRPVPARRGSAGFGPPNCSTGRPSRRRLPTSTPRFERWSRTSSAGREFAGASYKRLTDPPFNLSQEEAAKRVGLSGRSVVSLLALLEEPPEIQEMLARANISPRHVRALHTIENKSERTALAQQAASKHWSVEESALAGPRPVAGLAPASLSRSGARSGKCCAM